MNTDDYFGDLAVALASISRSKIDLAAETLHSALHSDKTLFLAGNGGSHSTASHLVCDYSKGLDKGYKIICLGDNTPTLTAYGNDIDFTYVFSRPLDSYGKQGDVIILISGSGNSPNIIRAAEVATNKGIIVIGLTGFDGGRLAQISDINLHVNIRDMQIVEDAHLSIGHLLFRKLKSMI